MKDDWMVGINDRSVEVTGGGNYLIGSEIDVDEVTGSSFWDGAVGVVGGCC